MILRKILISALFLFSQFIFAQTADHLVISEILINGKNESSGTDNDEFVEIYNPTSAPIDVSNWTIDYRSSGNTNSFSTKYTFPSGIIVQSHKFYLVGGGGVANRDNSTESQLLGLGNSGGAIFLRNSSGNAIDLVGWGTAVSGNYESSAASVPSENISLERKANNASASVTMGIGGIDEFEGNGFDSNNNANDFVQRTTAQPQSSTSAAEPAIDNGGNGTGKVSVEPNILDASETTDLIFKIAGDGTNTLDSVLVVIPSAAGWNWSGNLSDIIINGGAAISQTLSVEADTIYIGSISITSTDSLIIKISNVTAPNNSGYTDFLIKTSLENGIPLPVSPLPRINILKVIPIADIHINDAQGIPVSPYGIGGVVTISGIITADLNDTRTDIYVQDETAGINIFSFSRFFDYQLGDSVTVSGSILQFRGLTEISPDSALFFIHSHNNELPKPLVLTAEEINQTFNPVSFTEVNEGRLIRVNSVNYNSSNQTITDETGTTGAFIGGITPPSGTFDIVGILKQYKPGIGTPFPPFTSDYEISIRSQADIIAALGPGFLTKPTEKNIRPDSITIVFQTTIPSQVIIKYGKTKSYSDSIIILDSETSHSILLSGLTPATVYHYQVGITDGVDTNYTGDAIFSTASPYGTSGTINVFFNKSVNTSVSLGENAQTVNLSQKFIEQINSAQHSVDVALYSLSGIVGANIATALINAKARGVKVRVVGEKDNQGTAPWSTLKSNGINVIDDGYDAVNAGAGLMHNKFAVFDFRDTSSFADDWVWSGSWNATDPGTNNDAQNAIEIQDKALANAYTLEFNEMWGSDTDSPNSSNSRFGMRKTNNTPHKFNIAGTAIELYFDPSDETTFHIGATIDSSKTSVNVAMLTFTMDILAQKLVNKKLAGEKVRVILDNNSDSGNEFNYLLNNGVDIRLKGNAITGFFHHKYALIDAENTSADQITITGSHNWSNAAETANNENTLIIHSKRITNLYLQEFKARYLEAGGTDSIVTAVQEIASNVLPDEFMLYQNYPNPFNPQTKIKYAVPALPTGQAGSLNPSQGGTLIQLKVYDILGNEVATLVNREQAAGSYEVNFNASNLASGVYIYRLKAGNFISSKKLILMK